jgi:hypothetical protein
VKLFRVTVRLAITLGCFASDAFAVTPRTFVATVERVSDGDAITAITSNDTKLCTRLLGIEAPQVFHAKRLN